MPRVNQKVKEPKTLPSTKLRRTPVPKKVKNSVTKTLTKGTQQQKQQQPQKRASHVKPAKTSTKTPVVPPTVPVDVAVQKTGIKKLADKYEALYAPKKSRSTSKKTTDDSSKKHNSNKKTTSKNPNEIVTKGKEGGKSITGRIESIKDSSKIQYCPATFKKLVNVLGGESGKGLCYRNGIVRMGGASFHKKMQSDSEAFILEFVYRLVTLCATNNRRVITTPMVCKVSKTFGIDPVWIEM